MSGFKLKISFLSILYLIIFIGLSGCSKSTYSDSSAENSDYFKSEKSSLERAAPLASLEEMAGLSERNNDFAIRLYKKISDTEGNLVFSPYSISLAMAMLYAGAVGNTEKEISSVFNFPIPQDELHPVFNSLDLSFASRGREAKGQDGEGFSLRIANQLFMQNGFSVLEQDLDKLALYYGTGVGILDFENEPDESALAINRWIEDKTAGLIKNVIDRNSLEDIRLALVNTIYFNAAWDKIFNESLTDKRYFFPEGAPPVKVDMMRQQETFPCFIGDDYTAIELPYDGKELSMLVIMPKASGMSEFEMNLSTGIIDRIVDSLNPDRVALSLPRFKFSSGSLDLKKILASMGMPEPFTEFADFSGITGIRELKINDIIHKAFIDVNERGTKAAAVTVINAGVESMPDEIYVNRPFIFIIRDIETHSILFMGRVSKPL